MNKRFEKILRLIFITPIFLFFALQAFAQLTIGTVDGGPYTPGSTIAAPFTIGAASCIAQTNTFQLYLSDANGNFIAEKLIGSYTGFYSTYVNGVIPLGTAPGTGYKVRLKSTNPANVSTESTAFEIRNGIAVIAKISSTQLTPNNAETFGTCITKPDNDLALVNQSTSGSSVTASVKDELSGAVTPINFPTPNQIFRAQLAHYTVFVKAQMPDGTIGTKAYLIVNNQVTTAFSTTSNNVVCLPVGFLEFSVDLSAQSGILKNFPGDRYLINWGDGSSTSYSFCEIQAAGGKVRHDYVTSSCGRSSVTSSGTIFNAFDVTIRVANDFCGNMGTPVSSYAKVVVKPINSFTFTNSACTNTNVTFTNTSLLGENPNTNTPGCTPNNVTYNWFVDGVLVEANKPRSFNLVYKFTSHGKKTIKLTSTSSGACDADAVEQEICIQDSPQPIFTLPQTAICAPSSLKPIDASIIDNICNAANTYTWTVTPAVGFLNGTNASSKEPEFNFTTAGTYTISLSISTPSCGSVVSAPQTVTVSGANAGPDQIICSVGNVALNGNNVPGVWTIVSAQTVNIAVPTQYNTNVSGLVPGEIYVFRWTTTGGACPNSWDEVTVTYPAAITNAITVSASTVCSGQTIVITGDTPTGGNGTYTYQWQSSLDGVTWANLSGKTAKDLSVIVVANPTYFRRKVTSNLCIATSNEEKINVLPAIGNNIIGTNQSVCLGVPAQPLSGSLPTGADGTFIYQWQSSSDGTNWTNIAGETNQNYTPPIPTATISYRRLVSSGACLGGSQNLSNLVVITVNQPAKAEINFITDESCAPFQITAANVKAGLYPDRNSTFTWFANNIQIGTGATFPGYTITNDKDNVVIKLVVTNAAGCGNDETTHTFLTKEGVKVGYTQNTTAGCGPLSVVFTNTSSSLTGAAFKWDFGNGTTSNLAVPPTIIYQPDPGGKDVTYIVMLSATTACGTTTQSSTVLVKAAPLSIFSPDKTVGCSPFTPVFSNTSPGTNNTYTYDFGDGTILTTTDKNSVTHTYTTLVVKDYIVKMTAKNDCGSSESQYNIRVSPNEIVPELVVNSNELKGCPPLKVNFYNNTKGANTFYYDFGDGSTALTSTAPEMIAHTFSKPGTYLVTLYASNDCSSVSTTETIVVLDQPTVSFLADKTIGCNGTVVNFKNNSKNGVSYLWDFGDGATSTEFEPQHTYAGAGINYTVSLTAKNILGCTNTAVVADYIQIVFPPQSAFTVSPGNELSIPNFTFNFKDASLNGAGSWEWNFGDGATSTLQNPKHTYNNVGVYNVSLKILNKEGCAATSTQVVRIIGVPGYLNLPNSFMPPSAKSELRTFKAKGTGIETWNMSVFNKWGQLLWETTKLDDGAPLEGWDGTYKGQDQPQGVYFWKIDVKFINGSDWKGMTYDSSPPKKTGTIYLIR